ncbi:MAG: type 1 glutamine amidotransferase [Desulfuromonadales bacterium]|nr:type 1 glutamine amidotransferase [Desulfuromonadales bacterium]
MKALILSANNFEDLELLVPLYRLQEAGYGVDIAASETGSISGKHGYAVLVDKIFVDVDPADYAVLILPGGKAPAEIRDKPSVQTIVRAFFNADKPVGAICHGPKILVSAGLLNGRRATCCRTVAKYLQDAGAEYLDSEVVVDGRLVTSRQPDDLPAFMRELMLLLPPKTDTITNPDFPIPESSVSCP